MDFDDGWIKSFEEKQKQSMQTLKVFYCYIDNENTMQKINQEIIDVKNKVLTKDEIVKLIIKNKKKHELINILSFIVTNVNSSTDYKQFLKSIQIEDIDMSNSLRFFASTNSVFFMFKEFSKKLKSNTTKRIYITPSRNTRRKLLKANTAEV